MRTNSGILILFFFIIVMNFAYVSTTSIAQTSANTNRNYSEINLPANSTAVNQLKKLIEVSLSTKETACVKSQACKVLVKIENVSDQDAEIGGLYFWLIPSVKSAGENYKQDLTRRDFTSSVDLETLAILGPNEDGRRLILKSKERLEKEIDIAAIKWKKTDLSLWIHENLWKHAVKGAYRLKVSVGRFPKTMDPPQKETIGGVEVEIVNAYPDESDDLTLNFTNK